MLHEKTEYSSLDAPFAKKGDDIANGDMVEILSEGTTRPNRFDPAKTQTVIKIKTKNGARYLTINPKSINALIDEFGSNDDRNWIGKKAKVLMNRTIIGGKKVVIAYLVGQDWELDDWGEPVIPGVQKEPAEDIPIIDIDEEEAKEEIKISDVPF